MPFAIQTLANISSSPNETNECEGEGEEDEDEGKDLRRE